MAGNCISKSKKESDNALDRPGLRRYAYRSWKTFTHKCEHECRRSYWEEK